MKRGDGILLQSNVTRSPQRLSQRIQRILVVRTDRLGDVILTLPVLPLLRECFPEARISMLLRRYTGEIASGNPNVDSLIWYEDDKGIIPFRTMLSILIDERPTVALVVHPTLRIALLMFLAGIPIRVGTGYRYFSFLFNRRVYEHRKDALRHELEYNINLLAILGCTAGLRGKPPDFGIRHTEEDMNAVVETLALMGIDPSKKRVILHPGSGGSAREWPVEYFEELAGELSARGDLQVLVTGSEGEAERVARIARAAGSGGLNLAGKFTIRQLVPLIKGGSLFISNSTGPLHIAAAVGTPVLGFYPQLTPMSPRRWGPYSNRSIVLVPAAPMDCKKCRRGKNPPCACMASITVQEALDASVALLGGTESEWKREMRHVS